MLPAGHRLGPYEIVSALGAGGMGEVYRARDTRLDREVAVKVLSSRLAGDPAAVARFQREARAVAALSHPNIVALFDVGTEGDVAFVVTELLNGRTLRERLDRGPCDLRETLDLGVQLARGLAAAHEKGVVHRDLKPENVFLTAGGPLKILDFGLARQDRAAEGPQSFAATAALDTTPGLVMGTVGYMSPEQVRGQSADHRTDIFSLGAVLYEMAGGRRAFRGDTAADTMAAIVRDDPPDLQQLSGALPPALARVVSRCLAKAPSARFQSAGDLAMTLETLSQSGTSGRIVPAAPGDAASIVVLPFEDLSPERDHAYFADGLTDEIISDLSKIRDLRVISRASSMQLKGRRDVPAIARELNVRYVLDGSVRKAGPRLRITAQLVDATTDGQIWSEKYNGTIDDIFEIQEQVSKAIVTELKAKVTPEEHAELGRRDITDARAYECYLRARAEILRFTDDAMARAQVDLDAAFGLIGDNVLLLAAQGDVYWQAFNLGVVTDSAQLQRIEDLAIRIDRLQPETSHSYRLRGMVAIHRGDMQRAIRLLRRAMEIDPNETWAASIYVFCLGFVDRIEQAVPIAQRLLRIDPLEPLSHAALGWVVHYQMGELAAAIAAFRRALQLGPDSPAITLLYVTALAAAGRREPAFDLIERAERVAPGSRWTWLCRTLRWALSGDAAAIDGSLTLELRQWCAHDAQYSLHLAEVHALIGRFDEAFEWLEQVLALGACPYRFLAHHDSFLAPLRDDARWPGFIARVRDAWQRFEV